VLAIIVVLLVFKNRRCSYPVKRQDVQGEKMVAKRNVKGYMLLITKECFFWVAGNQSV